jgi:hypothetical protein
MTYRLFTFILLWELKWLSCNLLKIHKTAAFCGIQVILS